MSFEKITLLLLFATIAIYGQEPKEKPPKWEYEGFSYVDFGTGEEHSYFSLTREMNPKLHQELQGFYDSYRASDVTVFSYLMKRFLSKKVYAFSGVGLQIERSKFEVSGPKFSGRMMSGFGFEPKKNISIEAVYDYNFNTTLPGINSAPSSFILGGKYRFK